MKETPSAPDQNLLITPRLDLLPLTAAQLKALLEKPTHLGKTSIDQSVIDAKVIRAIGIKLEKTKTLSREELVWQTYWLIIIRNENIGVGLAGFKSPPNKKGLAEIGYGIAPARQNMGYMTEAAHALISWAFESPHCKGITATTVKNPASNRLLEKLGAEMIAQDEEGISWILRK